MSDPFSPEELATLSVQIDEQLRALGAPEGAELRGRQTRVSAQREAIARATGQDAATFLERFRQAARQDLCEAGGVLHAQWLKWKDLASKDLLKTFGGILVGLGLSGSALHIVVVAVAVYVLYVGVQAFCAGA